MLKQLKTTEIKEYREKTLKKQRGVCPLCKETLLPEHAAFDHCHTTGHFRGVLHNSCNSAEAKVLQWAGRRSRGDDPEFFLRNLIKYWKKDFTSNPLHPSFGKPKKRRRRNGRKGIRSQARKRK